MSRQTRVEIHGDRFFINNEPTYAGIQQHGRRIEGLLFNARLVQGIFDDLNPQTRQRWAYPDTGEWDAERNTREFVAAMPEWRRRGLLAFTLNLQGGSPQGYSEEQPWINSAVAPDGSLRPGYLTRLARILDRADELGMAVILGIFYFGQEKVLRDEAAIVAAVDSTVEWLFAGAYRNVLVEISNECNVRYRQPILRPERVHELIARVRARERDGHRFFAGTSYGGGTVPLPNVIEASDFALLHGNRVEEPVRIAEMVRQTRRVPGYRPMPVLFNEDDHFDFDKPSNNLLAAVGEYASWGYFDYRFPGEGFHEGYQSVPVDWGINSARKRGFFEAVRALTQTGAATGGDGR